MDGTSASPQPLNAQQRSAHIREVVMAEGVRLRQRHPWLLHQDALGAGILAFAQSWWSQPYFMDGYIAVFNLLATFITIALFALVMQCCWKRISALQFTLYMAISNLGLTAGSALIGPLRNQFSWNYTLLTFSVIALVALLIVQFINLKKHRVQVAGLENANQAAVGVLA